MKFNFKMTFLAVISVMSTNGYADFLDSGIRMCRDTPQDDARCNWALNRGVTEESVVGRIDVCVGKKTVSECNIAVTDNVLASLKKTICPDATSIDDCKARIKGATIEATIGEITACSSPVLPKTVVDCNAKITADATNNSVKTTIQSITACATKTDVKGCNEQLASLTNNEITFVKCDGSNIGYSTAGDCNKAIDEMIAVYDPSTGQVIIPKVMVGNDKFNLYSKVVLKQNELKNVKYPFYLIEMSGRPVN